MTETEFREWAERLEKKIDDLEKRITDLERATYGEGDHDQ